MNIHSNEKQSKKKDYKISRIKAGAYDTIAFDDRSKKAFAWGQFGNFGMKIDKENTSKCDFNPQFTPKLVSLHIFEDGKKNTFAVAQDKKSRYTVPDNKNKLMIMDIVTDIKTIHWGENHFVFTDNKQRTFVCGKNTSNELGLEYREEN